jgi:hypothetical protein
MLTYRHQNAGNFHNRRIACKPSVTVENFQTTLKDRNNKIFKKAEIKDCTLKKRASDQCMMFSLPLLNRTSDNDKPSTIILCGEYYVVGCGEVYCGKFTDVSKNRTAIAFRAEE